jgi:hypothetical protein
MKQIVVPASFPYTVQFIRRRCRTVENLIVWDQGAVAITIELVSNGVSPQRRAIASMHVGNISCLADISDYRVKVLEAANPQTGSPPRTATCVVAGHDRRQSVWALVAKAADGIQRAKYDELYSSRQDHALRISLDGSGAQDSGLRDIGRSG